MYSDGYIRQDVIRCPVCKQECDHLAFWCNIDAVSFFACTSCITHVLPGVTPTALHILEVGYRAGVLDTLNKIHAFEQRCIKEI